MKGKRLLAVVSLCLALLLGYAGATAQGTSESLTLKEAIRRGLESSAGMQNAKLTLQLVEIDYKQATVNAGATVSPLQLAETKQAFDNAQNQLALQQVQTALDVESQYYAVMKAHDTVLLREQALDRAAQQVDIAQRRHGAGQITDVQLREAEQRLKEAELSYRQATNNLQLARMEFGQLIGLAGDMWVLADNVTFAREVVQLDEALALANSHRFELIQAAQRVENATRSVRLADNAYTPKVDLERASIALAQAELALKQASDQVRHHVWQTVLRLDEAEARYYLAQDRLDLAADNLTLGELRYQNGLNTLLDVLQAESSLAEAEVEAISAAYDYNIARAQYLSSIGLGFERWPDLLEGSSEGVQ